MRSDILRRVSELAREPVLQARELGGGNLSEVLLVTLESGESLVAKRGKLIMVEAAMLHALAQTGAPCPRVRGVAGDLLLMDWIAGNNGVEDAWMSLAGALALVHAAEGDAFGWHDRYRFGDVPLDNRWCDNWPQFWAERRIACHVAHLPRELAARVERVAARLDKVLPARPRPALLHGDMWGGNVLSADGKVTGLIDPACYFGDREVDLAMLTVFDRPSDAFIEAFAPQAGWRERLPAYRLFPALVHLRLFGPGYRPMVEAELDRLGG